MNKEQIENEAHEATNKIPDDVEMREPAWYYGHTQGYIDGATAQHPKSYNEAIDACIQKLWDGAKPGKLWTEYQKDLEALKLDPNQA